MSKNKIKQYTILDFPKHGDASGIYKGTTPYQAAKKAFSRLSRMIDLKNTNRKNVLVFTIGEILETDNRERIVGKRYKYMGTRVELKNPIKVKHGNKVIQYNYRNIVSKYDPTLE